MAKKQTQQAQAPDEPEAWTVETTFTAQVAWGKRQYPHRFLAGHRYRIVPDDPKSAPVDGLHKTIQRSCYDLVAASAL